MQQAPMAALASKKLKLFSSMITSFLGSHWCHDHSFQQARQELDHTYLILVQAYGTSAMT